MPTSNMPACLTPHLQAHLETEVQSRPYGRVGIDITEMTVSARGNKYALVVMDYFSKYVHVFPMPNQTTEQVVECLLKVAFEQGVPERLYTYILTKVDNLKQRCSKNCAGNGNFKDPYNTLPSPK